MRLVLFVWAIICYLSLFTVKAGRKKDKYVEECKANFFEQFIAPKTSGCPCWPSHLQDIICTCSKSASGPFESGTDHDITCKIDANSKFFGVDIVACGGGYKNYISPYFEPIFVHERFGKSPFGICLNAPAGLADVIVLIIRVIKELADLFDEMCDFDGGKDEYRRKLIADEAEAAEAAFNYMEDLMKFTPTSFDGPEADQQRDELTAMIFKPAGLADVAMQMMALAEIKEMREEARGISKQNGETTRRLLGKKGSGCDHGDCGYRHYEDGPSICPYKFLRFLKHKTRGKYDPDQNPFEYVLEELECAVDDVDCDNIYNFQKYPVRCSIKRALEHPIRDECDKKKKKDGKDCDCDKKDGKDDYYGYKKRKNPLTKFFDSLPDIRLFITAYDQTKSCQKGLFKAAELLDEGIVKPKYPYKYRKKGGNGFGTLAADGGDGVTDAADGGDGEAAPAVSDVTEEVDNSVAADAGADVDADADAIVKRRPVRYRGCAGDRPCTLSSKGCRYYKKGGKGIEEPEQD